ncbi:MAG: spore germination protein GerW family protein [Bacillota bacterium]
MSGVEIKSMLDEAVEALKSMLSKDNVIGAPISTEGVTIIPVSKLTTCFATGNVEPKNVKIKLSIDTNKECIAGGVGGGVHVSPVGFLVVDCGAVRFIKTQGDNVDKWLDMVQDIVHSRKK